MLTLCSGFEKAIVSVVFVFDLEMVAEVREYTFKRLIVFRRYFQRSEDPAEIGPVVAVMEEADVPFAA